MNDFGAKPAVLRCSRCGKFVDWGDARVQIVCSCRPHLDLPPVLVREEAMYGTGFFPAERFEIYEVADEGLYLTGTSEVALAGLHMTEILDRDELPLRSKMADLLWDHMPADVRQQVDARPPRWPGKSRPAAARVSPSPAWISASTDGTGISTGRGSAIVNLLARTAMRFRMAEAGRRCG